MSELRFNDFANTCYNDAKVKGFYDSTPSEFQVDASRKFLQAIYNAAVDFELERKIKRSEYSDYVCSVNDSIMVKTALLASEIAEMGEWALAGEYEDQTIEYENYENGDYTPISNPKPEGYASEAADVVIRLGDMFGWMSHLFDIEQEVDRKLAYNKTRAYRNGKSF